MTVEHVVMLAAVELSASNNAIRFKEAATTSTVSITAGTYYLRGNGTADDLCLAVKTALETITGTNTYTVALTASTSATAAAGTVTISLATGTNTFQLLLADALTTFDESLLGFSSANTADDVNAKASTLSPSALWVSPDAPQVREEHPEYDVSVQRSRSGRVRALRRGGPYHILDLAFTLLDSRRVLRTDNTSDPAATFAAFLETVGDGTDFEIHAVAIASGTTLAPLTIYTRQRETWRFDEESSAAFRPSRDEPGMSLYSFSLRAEGTGDSLVLTEIVADAIFIFDPNDAASLTMNGVDIERADNSGGANIRHLETATGAVINEPDLVAGVVNGRSIARFTSGGTSTAALRSSTFLTGSARLDSGSWFASSINGAIPSFTRYIALKFSSILTRAALNDDTDNVFAGNLQILALYARETTGVYYARVKGRVGGVAVNTEAAGLSIGGWHVVSVRHGSGTLEIRIDDGAWVTVAAGNLDSTTNLYYGYNGSNGNGFNGDLAFAADYATRHSDGEADQMLAYINETVLGV